METLNQSRLCEPISSSKFREESELQPGQQQQQQQQEGAIYRNSINSKSMLCSNFESKASNCAV